jgi:sporulation protein YabP
MEKRGVVMHEREAMEVRGVNNVMAFDEEMIILNTDMGHLSVKGEGLHIVTLTLEEGQVAIKGRIDALEYRDVVDFKAKGQNLLKRLLK